MIEFIIGKVDYVHPQYIVIESNNIGYQVYCGNPFIFQQSDQEIKVYTYQHVREDILALYGFKTRSERALFVKLLNVSGIGPKGALAILATGQPDQVVSAIEREDEKFLTKFPGVGKKTARQIILDLKGKLQELVSFDQSLPLEFEAPLSSYSKELEEALEALKALGYAEREIKKIEPKLMNEEMTTDQFIKKALQLLLNQ
ncbi:Holliday junction branch migration protein RuvA [Bacillus taeanensis]|uniref:Holliday junction branch migration complex subunit RuvA n=1 Tax=Bacillus taeanensis TaxID=273032 RepID=A0A366XXX9_9BACI|nr:Holliday junction branch migration protein RuvA [Bacillus taeanensis]RBW70418.1 Holliday junction branch migration protein RuvA [Bacillus taeanensis]